MVIIRSTVIGKLQNDSPDSLQTSHFADLILQASLEGPRGHKVLSNLLISMLQTLGQELRDKVSLLSGGTDRQTNISTYRSSRWFLFGIIWYDLQFSRFYLIELAYHEKHHLYELL